MVLPLKPGQGQNIAMHASPTARDFFLELIFTHWSIHLHFFQNLSRIFPKLAVDNTGSCVGLQDIIGHPARRSRQLMQVPVLSARGIIGPKHTLLLFFLCWHFEIADVIWRVL